MISTLTSSIALEITIPESLFRQIQQILDAYPNENIDGLASKALSAYLRNPNQY